MIGAVTAYAKIKKEKIMNYRTLILLEGIVINVADTEEDCCTLRVSMRTEEEAVTILVAGETYVADNMRLRPGMRVAVFYDGRGDSMWRSIILTEICWQKISHCN